MKQGETTHDSKNYQQMSKPFESREIANESLAAFCEAVQALRREYRVANVIVIVKDSYISDEDEPTDFLNMVQFGNELEHEAMTAYAFGICRTAHRERMNKLITRHK